MPPRLRSAERLEGGSCFLRRLLAGRRSWLSPLGRHLAGPRHEARQRPGRGLVHRRHQRSPSEPVKEVAYRPQLYSR